MKVIMVRPEFDEVNTTLSKWAEDVLKDLSLSDDLCGELAIEIELRLALEKHRESEVIGFYGHGAPNFLLGSGNKAVPPSPLINTKEPGVVPSELSGRKLYAAACHAGADLGRSLADAGCEFVGYSMQFVYVPGFEQDFERVVNQGLIAWASQDKSREETLSLLKAGWDLVRWELSIGPRRKEKNAFTAALAAHWNEGYACCY